MLRAELISSLDKLLNAIDKANVLKAIQENEPLLSIFAFHTLAEIYSPPSPADEHLFNTFKLAVLLDLKWWADALSHGPERPDRGSRTEREEEYGRPSVHHRVTWVKEQLPLIVNFLKPASDVEDVGTRMTLLVPEAGNRTSSPTRVVRAIESIILIYSATCKLHNEQENTLTLRSCDSGSDKSFDFTGLPQIIEQVKVVIFGLVDRLIFFREMQYTERVKRVAESLPILDQINQLVDQKKLSPEQAELLKRDFINGATKFLETGSIIPELSDPSRYEPGTLIQTSPQLLLEGPSTRPSEIEPKKNERRRVRKPRLSPSPKLDENFSIKDIEEFVSSSETLSPEEREQIFKILRNRKARRAD